MNKTRGPLVLYHSPKCWGYVKISGYWGKEVKHSPWAGADNSLGPKFGCQHRPLTMVICCKFKKNLINLLTLYTSVHVLINVYSCMSGADNPRWQNFDVNRNHFSLRSSLKKSLSSLILYNFFHYFIHVYSPGAGADNPFRMKFWCPQEHLVTSVICCKFQKISLKSDFIHFFSLFYTCI